MPYPENTPTPDDLPGLSPQEIAALPVELLAILQREIDERLKCDKAAKTRLKNRVGKGVCPCCNRSFANLKRHMASQHPEFAGDES